MKKYTLEITMMGNEISCQECPCLTYDLEFGNEYCAGQPKEPDFPNCIRKCPLKEKK